MSTFHHEQEPIRHLPSTQVSINLPNSTSMCKHKNCLNSTVPDTNEAKKLINYIKQRNDWSRGKVLNPGGSGNPEEIAFERRFK